MNILLNGERYETCAKTLADLLLERDFCSKVATARNGEFVSANRRTVTFITAGDSIEVLSPMQGG